VAFAMRISDLVDSFFGFAPRDFGFDRRKNGALPYPVHDWPLSACNLALGFTYNLF
jgi:hypothetical protein